MRTAFPSRTSTVAAWLVVVWLMPVGAAWSQAAPEEEREPSASSVALGFSAGPNLTTLDVQFDLERRSVEDYSVVVGYYLTLYTGFKVNILHVRSGISFVNAGALYDGTSFLEEDAFKVHFLTIPVDVRLKIPLGKGATPYLFAGPQFRYQFTPDDLDVDVRDDLNHLTTTGSLGLGIRLTVPGTSFSLSPELRYAVDVRGLFEGDVTVRDEVYRIGDAFKADMVQFGVVLGL
jgi:hypothetical protein